MTHKFNRRIVLTSAGGMVPMMLSGCLDTVPLDLQLPSFVSEEQDSPVETQGEFSPEPPQFFQAEPNAPQAARDFVEIGFSLHCGGTRDWFRDNGLALADDISSGRTLAFFSHLVRSENELPVGVELMRVGEARYPEAVLASIGLSLKLNRSVSALEVKEYLRALGMRPQTPFKEKTAEIRLLGVAKVYYEGLGISETPFIKKTPLA